MPRAGMTALKAPPAAGPLRARGLDSASPHTLGVLTAHGPDRDERPGVVNCWHFSFPSHRNVPAAPHWRGCTGTRSFIP